MGSRFDPEGEMILTPELLGILALTTAIGYSMLVAGVHKSMLEWRARRRPCPSCGKQIEGRVCGACTSV